MLKDNFAFIDNSSAHKCAVENNFSNKLLGFLLQNFEPKTKDYTIGNTKQSDTGNCWILSGITALSYSEEGRNIIKNSLEYKKGYTIVHTICGDYVVLDSEVLLTKADSQYSDGDDDMIIFELAFEKIIDDYVKKRIKISKITNYLVKKTLKNSLTKEGKSSTELGFQGACFYFLTGIEPVCLMTQVKMSEYLEKLKENKGKSLALCASSHVKFKKIVKDIYNDTVPLYSSHCYAIKSFDGKKVTVLNPHDTSKNIILTKQMFFNMFANIQARDLSLKDCVREYFSTKIYYNKLGRIEKTIETDDNGYHIEYNYFYNRSGKPIKAECNATHESGLYTYCSLDFSTDEKYIENGNRNSQIALLRYFINDKLVETKFGKFNKAKIFSKIPKSLKIPNKIGKQIKEYALYQYENLDEEKILMIAKDISNNDFSSAFKYCT